MDSELLARIERLVRRIKDPRLANPPEELKVVTRRLIAAAKLAEWDDVDGEIQLLVRDVERGLDAFEWELGH